MSYDIDSWYDRCGSNSSNRTAFCTEQVINTATDLRYFWIILRQNHDFYRIYRNTAVIFQIFTALLPWYFKFLPQYCRDISNFYCNTATIFAIFPCCSAAIFCLFYRTKYLPLMFVRALRIGIDPLSFKVLCLLKLDAKWQSYGPKCSLHNCALAIKYSSNLPIIWPNFSIFYESFFKL